MTMAIPIFKPKKGQIDYTDIRWVPVINCIVQCGSKILLVKRNSKMKLYPNYWSGISGFLDDARNLQDKVKEELREEVGISKKDILSITLGEIFDQNEPRYKKSWIVHPVLVKVKSSKIKTDWEAQNFRWIVPREASEFRLLPGLNKVLLTFFPTAVSHKL